jgi:hypothetical protein
VYGLSGIVERPDLIERSAGPALLPLRRAFCALLLTGLWTGACERSERQADEQAEPLLTLRVETPEALDWGGTGMLRLTLANEGDAAAEGGIVQVYVPDWLEFGSVEPPGTAVTVVSGDAETSLQYQLTDSLPPGDSRVIIQHLRVRERARPPVGEDSIETVQIAPSNQLVRARLLTASGEAVGVEVQATLNFVGWSGPVPPTGDTVPDTSSAGNDTLTRPPGGGVRDTTRSN